MSRNSTLYILIFATIVCVICSVLVSGAAVALKPKQEENVVLDRQRQVLYVAGILEPGEPADAQTVQRLFDERIRKRFVDLETGEYVPEEEIPDAGKYNPVAAAKSKDLGKPAPPNPAGVLRQPKIALAYEVLGETGEVEEVILQVWGQGLWSTLYGYLALAEDGNTVKGITFYEHAETPGLGGEVDNPRWKAHWVGRKIYNEEGEPAVVIRKGGAAPPEEDPHGFDSISGATITSRGVEHLVNFWLSDAGYGPYLDKFREAHT